MEMTNNKIDNSLSNNKMAFQAIQENPSYLSNDIEQPTWWQRRTRLEKRMLMGVGFLFIVGLACMIAVVVLATKTQTEEEFTNLVRSSIKHISADDQQSNVLCTTQGCLDAATHILESMDTQANPCDDFYRYVCGNWERTHAIPVDKANINLFSIITDKLMLQLRNIIELPKKPDEGTAIHTAKDIYEACISVDVADSLGMPTFRGWVDALGGWPMASEDWDESNFDWQKVNLQFMKENSVYLISANPNVDVKNNSENILYISLAGTALQVEYLLRQSRYPAILAAYRTQIRKMATLFSASGNLEINETDIDEVLRFEVMLANVTNNGLNTVDLSNLDSLYNKMTIREVNAQSKGKFDWLQFLKDLYLGVRDITEDDVAVISLPTTLPDFFDSFETFPRRTVANYMIWRYALKYIWHINTDTRLASFEYQRVVSGVEVQPARWVACVGFMNSQLGDIMGSIYARDVVPRDTKALSEDMITDLRKTIDVILDNNDWMDKPTLDEAKIKAKAMIEFVAYPDWAFNNTYLDDAFQDLTGSRIDIVNFREISQLMGKNILKTLNQPVVRNEWIAAASTVNAFYAPSKNALIFPAGILQPPFFSPTNLNAMNYGAIGSVIGHEITHGFDNEGRQNDENGNLADWWTQVSVEAYGIKASCIRNQYGAYCNDKLKEQLNLPTTPCVDSNNTLSENIADNGGMKVALQAYKAKALRDGPEPKLPGLSQFTPLQLFFISFGQVWCENSRPKKQFQTIMYDVHSPSPFRVRGVLSNVEDFALAFNCPSNSTMNPKNRCSFW